jgi:hypothetical protein
LSASEQGTTILYGGNFEDAVDYFDALKHIRANPRFSLHSAEAVLLRALLSLDPLEVARTTSLLVDVEKQVSAQN